MFFFRAKAFSLRIYFMVAFHRRRGDTAVARADRVFAVAPHPGKFAARTAGHNARPYAPELKSQQTRRRLINHPVKNGRTRRGLRP